MIVPAHNEAGSIASNLRVLLANAAPGEFDVVVVCNGCTDATADEARTVAGVRVLELEQASKIAAIRAGDAATDRFPRIYLDGDIRLPTATARRLRDELVSSDALVAGVPGRLDLSAATRPARWFLAFRSTLPVFRSGIIGAGVYALSETGRARFGDWPQLLGDDQFIYRLFTPAERVTLPGHPTTVEVPASLRTIVRRGVRIRRGNSQLDHLGLPRPPSGARLALAEALRTPGLRVAAAVFVLTTAWIRLRTRFGAGGDW